MYFLTIDSTVCGVVRTVVSRQALAVVNLYYLVYNIMLCLVYFPVPFCDLCKNSESWRTTALSLLTL